MRLHLVPLIILLLLPVSLSGMDIDVDSLDLENVQMSIAGPDTLYLRSILYNGTSYSILVQAENLSGTVWKLVELFPGDKNLAPRSLILDYTRITTTDGYTITIDGIIIDGQSYSIGLQGSEDGTFTISRPLYPAPPPDTVEEKIKAFKGALLSVEKGKYLRQIEKLQTKNLELQQQLSQLQELGNSRPDSEAVEAFQQKIAEYTKEIEQYREQIEKHTSTIEEQKEQLQQSKSELASCRALLEERNTSLSTYTDQITQFEQELRQSEQQIDTYEETIASLKQQKTTLEKRIEHLDQHSDARQKRIDELKESNENLEWELRNLRFMIMQQDSTIHSLKKAESTPLSLSTIKQRLTNSVLNGFVGCTSKRGSWDLQAKKACRTDADQYVAELTAPELSLSEQSMFSFTAQAPEEGWVGLGIHLATEGQDSLIVWLTRDRAFHEDDQTRLQLFRTDDTVTMEQELDAVVEPSITGPIDVDIYYRPKARYISVFLNGKEYLSYQTWFSFSPPVTLTFRAQGKGTCFTEPRISTLP